jgi:uncharacterized protein YggE
MGTRRLLWITATILAASALAGVGAPTLIRASSSDPQPGTISVTGTGSVDTAPDTATMSFGVTTQASTAQEAMSQNSQQTAQLIAALKGAGVDAKDLQTQYVSLDLQYDSDGRNVVGYTASNSVSATVRKLANVGDVIDAGIKAGANNVSGPTLSRDDRAKLYEQALERAVAAAKAKAEVLARASGGTVGAVQSVTENPQDVGGPEPATFAAAARAVAVPIEAGTAQVTANVRVVFALG